MTLTTTILTFGGSAVQFPAAGGNGLIRWMRAEPLRANTHPAYIGTSAVTNDASGTGVIKEVATPPAATVGLDSFTVEDMGGDNRIDPTLFYAHGFSTEKLKVSYSQG